MPAGTLRMGPRHRGGYVQGMRPIPKLIQGGMGVGVSDWRLARAVASLGQLGVVSSTGLDTVLVRRLQDGDAGGHLRRACSHFPWPEVAGRVLQRWFRPAGRPSGERYGMLPLYVHRTDPERDALVVLANFAEVWLAREGHDGPVGINLLTKIQPPTLPALYGAMLAGVAWVLMGAGIPREIPGALDALAAHAPAALLYEVAGATAPVHLTFDPRPYWSASPAALPRPQFLAIVAAHSLATMLQRKANGRVDGFVVEGPTAGGHNAPPRGELVLDEHGQPVYGPRDVVDFAVMRGLGVPFWLAGGVGSPAGVQAAWQQGAAGVQVGTLFAFCDEAGISRELKDATIAAADAGSLRIHTDPRASPTGYPFKIVQVPGVPESSPGRDRVCDLGYLRTPYLRPDGTVGQRCSGEPREHYVQKGGDPADTTGRRCLCNALMANIGLGQVRREGVAELPLLTAGDDLVQLGTFLAGRVRYGAADVVQYLLGAGVAPVAALA